MASSRADKRDVGTREAAGLALALWGAAYVIFVASGYATEYARPKPMMNNEFHLLYEASCALAGLVISGGLYFVLRDASRLRAPARVALIAVGVLCASVLHSMFDAVSEAILVDIYLPKVRVAPFLASVSFNFLVLVWLHGLFVAGLGMLQFAAALRQRELQLAEARTLAHQAQLAALRFQLNPHFLFNTLNAVSTLVVTGRNADAETMLGRLCEFLRMSLASDPHAATPLAEELGTVEAYLEIESVRFGERLQVEFACPPTLGGALVPSLVLQPLVENAVKYAVAPARRPVTVRVTAATAGGELTLTVEDDGDATLAPGHGGAGVGLENARRRLVALYGADGGLEAGRAEGGGWRTVLRLPLRTAEDARRAA